jgi:hypothetical protein
MARPCALGLAAIAVDRFLWDLPRWPLLALLVVAFAIYLRLGTVRRAPVEVGLPVTGQWRAWNSPADRVPSHHLHAYGQTYAIDLVHDPAGGWRPGFAWWPLARRLGDFPGSASRSCPRPPPPWSGSMPPSATTREKGRNGRKGIRLAERALRQ